MGKTYALAYKIKYLVDRKKVDPNEIVVVTFTNEAANNMRKRISLKGEKEVYFLICFFSNIPRSYGSGLPKTRCKNIKIAHKKIFSFEFFAPFNLLFLEEEHKAKCLKNQRFLKTAVEKSISGLMDDLMFRLCNALFSFFRLPANSLSCFRRFLFVLTSSPFTYLLNVGLSDTPKHLVKLIKDFGHIKRFLFVKGQNRE